MAIDETGLTKGLRINRPPVSISVSDMESSPVMNSGFK